MCTQVGQSWCCRESKHNPGSAWNPSWYCFPRCCMPGESLNSFATLVFSSHHGLDPWKTLVCQARNCKAANVSPNHTQMLHMILRLSEMPLRLQQSSTGGRSLQSPSLQNPVVLTPCRAQETASQTCDGSKFLFQLWTKCQPWSNQSRKLDTISGREKVLLLIWMRLWHTSSLRLWFSAKALAKFWRLIGFRQ